MKFIAVALLSVAVLGIQLVFARPACTLEEFAKKFLTDNSTYYPSTKEELGEMCKKVLPLQENMIEYARKCPPESEVGKMLNYLRSSKEMYDSLCTDGTRLNTKYIANAKCFASLKDAGDGDCAEIMHPDEFNVNEVCSDNFMYQGCYTKFVAEKCGRDAASVLRAILAPHLEYFRKEECCSEKPSQYPVAPGLFFF